MSEELKKLRDNHKDFSNDRLIEPTVSPFELFSTWFDEAVKNNELESNALCLSTVNSNGIPSSRIVYLKELVEESFVFYTNYASQKGEELSLNPIASMLFFWPKLQRQVRITGSVSKISEENSDAYFASRPRESQLGAWASYQSEILADRNELFSRITNLEQQFKDSVPRPPHWGGYALMPSELEFWQGQPSRLHDRLVYIKISDSWKVQRKNP
ncbi:MAG TPA: pyridoxamine 5'-phosphate oxidase [Crocinitomicaceae bacterium]|nr:pyridoxamine 5'-phosphate oxidase [Flavobacteriales bacterium]HBW85719.1 pyridoxamine 5'-phosphate oxidase [Crocinitomicaceae bacterium]